MNGTFQDQICRDFTIVIPKLDFGNFVIVWTEPNLNLAGVGFLERQVVEFLHGHSVLLDESPPTSKTFNSRLRGILPTDFHSVWHLGDISRMASSPFFSAAFLHFAS